MNSARLFQLRSARSKRCAIVTMLALVVSPMAPPFLTPTVRAQAQQDLAPVGSGFTIDAEDLRFIYRQILVAQDHAAPPSADCPTCGTLLGPGPNQVNDPQLPRGLRTVDGSFNNLVQKPSPVDHIADQHLFGSADRVFPRLLTPLFRGAEQGTSYLHRPVPPPPGLQPNDVMDSQPRIISNLIVDQSATNPAAVFSALNPCGSGGFVCSKPGDIADVTDPASGALFIPNITPDFGLSAPFNLMFTFFGQFFDHGLDLVPKSGGTVFIPLQPDDPLYVPDSPTNFMVMTRGETLAGPDGIVGTADDIQDSINQTTPWVDQNQTYTSHPSHQVFLREYEMAAGKPVPNGKVLDGGFCALRPTGYPDDRICDIGNWAEVKAQASNLLGIHLVDQDVLNVPFIITDPYGHFKPGAHGFPQMVGPGGIPVEGDPTVINDDGRRGVSVPDEAFRTGHAFLNDIAHNAVPSPGLTADTDTDICNFRTVPSCQQPDTYDNELLDRHFITGDGRGNENIGLTTIHQLFHAEHNRLMHYIDHLINQPGFLDSTEVAAWHAPDPHGSGWGYGERLFQAARFATEMQYQHLVFEEFARKVQPLINPFLGGLTNIDPAISAEFAHTVYRLGHSMLPERLDRKE